jgi:23S rRNA (guanosine2251-2'-O)-methyltransferase
MRLHTMHTLILHNIRSVYNVGSIFRTADAVGVSKIILSGYTPAPLDRFKQPRADLAKVALGAEKNVRWEQAQDLSKIIKHLQHEDFMIVALEQSPRSTPLFDFKAPKNKPIALILGNEVRGVSKQLLAKCDAIVEIPMRGKKESLNVSVAAGIAMFNLMR